MTPHDPPNRRSAFIHLPPKVGLAVLGLLVTHQTSYSLATWLQPVLGGDGGHVDHGHQSLLVAAGGPLTLWVTAWFVLRQLRNLHVGTTWGTTALSYGIAGLFLAQESIENLAAGPTGPGLRGLIDNRAIVIGLLLVPLVARVLLKALDRTEELIRAWLAHPSATATGRPLPVPRPCSVAPPWGVAHLPGDPRGPPVRDVTTVQPLIS